MAITRHPSHVFTSISAMKVNYYITASCKRFYQSHRSFMKVPIMHFTKRESLALLQVYIWQLSTTVLCVLLLTQDND